MHNLLKRTSLALAALLLLAAGAAARQQDYRVVSPNRKIELRVRAGDRVRYDVLVNGRALLRDSTLSLDVEHRALGVNPKVLRAAPRSHEGFVEPVVRQKS